MTIQHKVQAHGLKIVCACIMLITVPCCADSGERPLKSRVLDGQIEFFYVHHTPQTTVEIIKEIALLGEIDYRYCFFAALFKTYPQQVFTWLQDARIPLESHGSLIHALWEVGLQNEAIYRALKANWPPENILELSNLPKPILELPVEHGGYLSCMSGFFSVTGDTQYIGKIIDVLALTPEKVSPSFNLPEFKEDAQYDLMRLMYHHERVYQLCLQESQSRSGEAGRLLKALMKQNKALVEKGSLPERNGMLNGDILITDDPSFQEKWTTLPVDSGPIGGHSVASIPFPKEGKLLKIVFLFSGFALDPELNGYVTYNIDVYDPDGEHVFSAQEKQGLRRKVPSRFLVQAADDGMELQFEAVTQEASNSKDLGFAKIGSYTIQGIITDHVGNTELTIRKTLEILPPIPKEIEAIYEGEGT